MFARSLLSRVLLGSNLTQVQLPATRLAHVVALSEASADVKKLYVGNLAWAASKHDLLDLFSKFGEVSDAYIPTDRETGRPRGFAFVTIAAEGADAAVAELNGTEFQGRELRVNEAQPKQQGGAGFGGGRGGYGGFRRQGGGGGGYRSRGNSSSYDYDSY